MKDFITEMMDSSNQAVGKKTRIVYFVTITASSLGKIESEFERGFRKSHKQKTAPSRGLWDPRQTCRMSFREPGDNREAKL